MATHTKSATPTVFVFKYSTLNLSGVIEPLLGGRG